MERHISLRNPNHLQWNASTRTGIDKVENLQIHIVSPHLRVNRVTCHLTWVISTCKVLSFYSLYIGFRIDRDRKSTQQDDIKLIRIRWMRAWKIFRAILVLGEDPWPFFHRIWITRSKLGRSDRRRRTKTFSDVKKKKIALIKLGRGFVTASQPAMLWPRAYGTRGGPLNQVYIAETWVAIGIGDSLEQGLFVK